MAPIDEAPPKIRRKKAIISAASRIFLRRGYAAATMSEISLLIGGSKATLWNYFPNKKLLYVAVVDDLTKRYADLLGFDLPDEGDPVEILRLIGTAFLKAMTLPDITNLHRMVIAESARFPEIGQVLWNRGPARTLDLIAQWFSQQMEAGQFIEADAMNAARQFLALCQAGSYWQNMFLGLPLARGDDLAKDVDEAVSVFIAAYKA